MRDKGYPSLTAHTHTNGGANTFVQNAHQFIHLLEWEPVGRQIRRKSKQKKKQRTVVWRLPPAAMAQACVIDRYMYANGLSEQKVCCTNFSVFSLFHFHSGQQRIVSVHISVIVWLCMCVCVRDGDASCVCFCSRVVSPSTSLPLRLLRPGGNSSSSRV